MTTQNNKPSRANTIAKDQMVILGVQKDLNTMSSLLLGASTYTPSSLTALVQSRIDAANAVATAKAAWQHAAATYQAVNTQVSVVVHDLKQFVIGAFGTTSPKLADFGFVPRTVTPLTADEMAAAVAKRAATRKARGTTGPKAKLKITGTVPPTAPATTAPATAPSNAAPTTTQTTPSTAPAAGSTAAPGQAPTVTVNVTTVPTATSGTQPAATTQTTPGNGAAASTAVTTAPAAAAAPAKS